MASFAIIYCHPHPKLQFEWKRCGGYNSNEELSFRRNQQSRHQDRLLKDLNPVDLYGNKCTQPEIELSSLFMIEGHKLTTQMLHVYPLQRASLLNILRPHRAEQSPSTSRHHGVVSDRLRYKSQNASIESFTRSHNLRAIPRHSALMPMPYIRGTRPSALTKTPDIKVPSPPSPPSREELPMERHNCLGYL